MFACTQAWSQQTAPPPEAKGPADGVEPAAGVDISPKPDNSTHPTPTASQRLAIEARQLRANIDAPPAPVWINVDGEEVLGFWQEDMSGNPIGAVLMLHAQGHSSRWPETLLNVHQVLPRFGWATLSIELPSPAALSIPEHPRKIAPNSSAEAAQKVGETPNDGEDTEQPQPKVDETQVVHQDEEAMAPSEAATVPPERPPATEEETEEAAMARIRAAYRYLQQQNPLNIVLIGEGLGAARALKFAVETDPTTAPLGAIVLLDALTPDGSIYAPERLLRLPEVPTMDLITAVGFDVRLRAAKRKQISQKMQYRTYLVRRIMPQVGAAITDKESDVTKTIRGFIKRYHQDRE